MRSADVMGVGARLPDWGGRWDRGSSSGRGGMPSGFRRRAVEDPEIGFHGVELDDGMRGPGDFSLGDFIWDYPVRTAA